jgi:hypothetical protein
MTAFGIRGPVHPDAQADISAMALRTGPLIHTFAEIEVLVSGWLWKLHANSNEALRFLSKTTAIGKRIDKLIKLLRQENGSAAFIADLQKVSEYREIRNAIVHGVHCPSGTLVSIVTWRGHAHISTKDLDDAIRETNNLAIKIFNAYTIRYGSYMDLNFVASQTPPATS